MKRLLTGVLESAICAELQRSTGRNPKVRLHHVANMRRLPLHGRRDYLANVERREGPGARAMLEDAFMADWEARRK